jgi:hypothetical protein
LSGGCCNLFSLIESSLFEIGTVHDSARAVGGSFDGTRRSTREPAVNALACRIRRRNWRRRAWGPSAFRCAVTVSSKGLNTSQRRERRTLGPSKERLVVWIESVLERSQKRRNSYGCV